MAHTHHHASSGYYLDQLCTIGVCGALGGLAVQLWNQGSLAILADQFQLAVLAGGIALLLVTAVRAVALWREVGRTKAALQDHAHEHGPDCDHDHHHHEHHHDHDHAHAHSHGAHAHTHDHDHGWVPVRYVFLILPIALFLLGMPNQKFITRYYDAQVKISTGMLPSLLDVWLGRASAEQATVDTTLESVESKGVWNLGFNELAQAANDPQRRDEYSGHTASLLGQFTPRGNDRLFELVRMKITCCGADARPINVTIISPEPVTDVAILEWVKVTGVIQFRKGSAGYVPVLQLADRGSIEKVAPPLNPFLY